MGTIWQPDLLDGAGPKYKTVMTAIRAQIARAALLPGDKLPPVRDLAWRLGITPGTVARAYTILTDEGVLVAEVGRGTFVAHADPKRSLLPEVPLEMESAPHKMQSGDGHVNLFSPHLPNAGQAQLIRQLLTEVAQDPPSGLMHYPTRKAARPAREAGSAWLADAPLGALDPEDVVLTNGGQNAILLTLQTLLKGRRPCVLVEELSYPGFRRAAELLRAEVVPVAMDADGILPDALAAAARAHDAQVLCLQPEVHNPTLGFMPAARRKEVAAVAERYDLQIIEDDCYRLGPAQAASCRMIVPDRTWYISSISKSVTPALRIGMAITPPGQGNALRRTAEYSFFGLSTPLIDLTAKLLPHPSLPPIMEAVRTGVGDYVRCAVNVLGAYDLTWRADVPFLWLTLPEGWRAGAFVQAAEREGVRIRAAEEYACRDARAPHAVRFAVNAGLPIARFEQGIAKLRALLDNPPDQLAV